MDLSNVKTVNELENTFGKQLPNVLTIDGKSLGLVHLRPSPPFFIFKYIYIYIKYYLN